MTRRQVIAAACASVFHAGEREHVAIVRLPDAGIQPQVAQDSRGVLHVVYYRGDARAGDLLYSRFAGASFSGPLPVNRGGSAIAAGTIRGAQIAIGRNSRVHVVWNGSRKPEGFLYTRLNDMGSAFETERNLMRQTHTLDGGGAIAADDAGNVYAMWHAVANNVEQNESNRRVWIAASRDDGASFARENKAWEENTGACACCGMKAYAGSAGVYALYRSAREGVHRDVYLLRSSDRGRSYQGKLLHPWNINACPMSSMDIASHKSRTAAAWETGGQIYWSNLGSGEPIAAPGPGKGRKHPRLAINAKGETLLVWTEGTGWQRGGSLAWQLYSAEGKPTYNGVAPGVPVWSFGAAAANPDGTFSILY